MWIFDSSFLSPRDVDRQLAELGLGLRRDQAWDFDISFPSPRDTMYHPTLNPARSLNRSQSHESRTHECKSSTAGKTKGSDFLGSTVHGRFRSFFTRTVVGKTANWDSQAIFQPPFRLGVGDSNWNSPQTINGCDACVCACVCIACTKV